MPTPERTNRKRWPLQVASFPDGPSEGCELVLQRVGSRWQVLTPYRRAGRDRLESLRTDVDDWLTERCGAWGKWVWDATFELHDEQALAAFMELLGQPLPEPSAG